MKHFSRSFVQDMLPIFHKDGTVYEPVDKPIPFYEAMTKFNPEYKPRGFNFGSDQTFFFESGETSRGKTEKAKRWFKNTGKVKWKHGPNAEDVINELKNYKWPENDL